MTTFSVTTAAGSVAWDSLHGRVAASLERGERAFELALSGATLDAAGMSTIVSALREVRERGGTVVLRTDVAAVLATLAMTGLDRVFAVNPATATGGTSRPSARVAPRHRTRFALVALVVSVVFAALVRTQASAQAEASPTEILRHVMARDGDMRPCEAHVTVDIRLRSFPYASQHLAGTTYFKRPATEVVFDSVPSIAKGFDKLYADVDDPSAWEARFDVSAAGEKTIDGHRDLVLRMVQKVRGMIDHEDVAIDVATWRIDEMEWHYYNGGVISMTEQYRSVGPFVVLASQHATIHIPFVHAAADATYSDYRSDVAKQLR